VTFTESISTCLSRYATFSGRASRSEYWWFYLAYALVGLVPIVGPIVGLGITIPQLAAGARRLHDVDRSGWWQAPPSILVFLGLILLEAIDETIAVSILVLGLASAIPVVVWLATAGKPEANRFGPPPEA